MLKQVPKTLWGHNSRAKQRSYIKPNGQRKIDGVQTLFIVSWNCVRANEFGYCSVYGMKKPCSDGYDCSFVGDGNLSSICAFVIQICSVTLIIENIKGRLFYYCVSLHYSGRYRFYQQIIAVKRSNSSSLEFMYPMVEPAKKYNKLQRKVSS